MISCIIKYFFLLTFTILWVVGSNPTLIKLAYKTLNIPSDYRFGDLYRFSYLPQFKDAQIKCLPLNKLASKNDSIHLFIIGDSFTEKERIDSSFFSATKYSYVHWNHQLDVNLDKSKKNILVIETVERHFREHFTKEVRNFNIVSTKLIVTSELPVKEPFTMQKWEANLSTIDDALEKVWFSGDLFLWFKEKKAQLNYKLFNRTNENITLSKDKSQILYFWETEPERITSSFNPVSDTEINHLVENLKATKEYYLQMGFSEVYFSIIPNKTSIVASDLGNYNHLVERVESFPNAKIQFLSVWKEFNQNASKIYLKGDTHWTCFGENLWVEKVNRLFF